MDPCSICHGEGIFEKYVGESDYGLRGDTVSIYHKYYCYCMIGRKLERFDCRNEIQLLEAKLAEIQGQLNNAREKLRKAIYRRGKHPVFICAR
jgi:hypothetical protein